MAIAIALGLAVVGAIIAAAGGSSYRTTVASVLFIGGGLVILWNAVAGGGLKGRRFDIGWSGTTSVVAPADQLAWVGVGVLVLAAGLIPALL